MENSNSSHKVVLISAMFVFGLGWFNAEKQGKNPSGKFMIGAGLTFTALSFLADFSPQMANALALAITTTALFSEGNGILSYINGGGELNTPSAKDEKASQEKKRSPIKKTTNDDTGPKA